MRMRDQNPEQRAEVRRKLKERYPDADLGDDVEIVYYLFPMDRVMIDYNKAKPNTGRSLEAKKAAKKVSKKGSAK